MIDGFPRQRGLLRLGGAPHLPLQALADELRSLTGRDVQPVPAEPVSLPGGAAARVPALRAQLAAGDIDCAVHALAELPTTPEPQLAIAATPTRDDPRDVLLASRPLRELVRGTVVGTASARRLAMLRRLRPDLTYHLIDGDAQLCMDMLADGHLAAVVCARLDLGRRKINVGQVFGIEQVLPDPGQGALVLECPNDRYDVIDTVRVLHDLRTWRAISAERALLAALDPEDRFVVGGYAADDGHLVSVTAAVLSLDGRRLTRTFGTADSTEAADLGHRLGADLHAAVASWNMLTETGTGETT